VQENILCRRRGAKRIVSRRQRSLNDVSGRLAVRPPTATLDAVKTITNRKFYADSDAVHALKPGESLLVTTKGKPAFVVTKAKHAKPGKKAADIREETEEIFPGKRTPFDGVALLRTLR